MKINHTTRQGRNFRPLFFFGTAEGEIFLGYETENGRDAVDYHLREGGVLGHYVGEHLSQQSGHKQCRQSRHKISGELNVFFERRAAETDVALQPESDAEIDWQRNGQRRDVRREDHKPDVEILFGEDKIESRVIAQYRHDEVYPSADDIAESLLRYFMERLYVKTVQEMNTLLGNSFIQQQLTL